MEAPHHKGINFKQTVEDKLLLIQPETFLEYCSNLPRNEFGWVMFKMQTYRRLSKQHLFAKVHPLDPKTLKKVG